MTRRVVFNQKGGVGKTTLLCNLAAIAAARGKRTLVIDLDAQCNASQYLLSSADRQADAGSADFFESILSRSRRSGGLEDFITPSPFENLSVMAAHPDLEELRVKLEAKHKIYKLKQSLERLDGFDCVFIDTPPALNFYSQSALIAADRCLIPSTATISRARRCIRCSTTSMRSKTTTIRTSSSTASWSTSFRPAPSCPRACSRNWVPKATP